MPLHTLDTITDRIIASSIDIHRTIGGGLFERVYEILLHRSLRARGLRTVRQHSVTFWFDGIEIRKGFRVDLLVEETVIVELKSVAHIRPAHEKQVLTYLRLMKLPVGLLLNFGQATLRDGLRRIVNDLDPDKSPLLRVNRFAQEIVNDLGPAKLPMLRK